ncbi:glycosyl transferase [Pedobacter sp. BAL39]|uniref:hypothetical protein n=1 Tax=Pedobacter sp. BAL39 TaxID=391596 RepID=UPI0001559232|nr:hypothetical protein [Pedobacter sp. BAL39]EDM35612.1 glycosyl transferase [Pedobacter sp. BAL39]
MNIFIYAVLVFLTLRFSVTLFNFISNPKLGDYRRKFSEKVTIVIRIHPDQEAVQLLDSISKQDYEHLEVVMSDELPDVSDSSYVLVLDPNTSIQNGLINSLVYRARIFNLSMLSIIPTQQNKGFLPDCLFPVADFVLLNLFPLRAVRLINHPIFSAAHESCLFFEAGVYRKLKLHQQVTDSAIAVTDVVKALKQEQLKVDVLLGNRLVNIQHRADAAEFGLFSKRLMLSFSNYAFVALIYVLLVVAGPALLLLRFAPVFYILPFGLIFLSRIMISFMTAQNPVLSLILHPLQMIGLTFTVLSAFFKGLFTAGRQKK